MNLAIIGVIPWQQAMESKFVASEFMEILYGRQTADVFTWLILWTVAACVFAMTLGYSRIPYAAARTGGFFRVLPSCTPSTDIPSCRSRIWGFDRCFLLSSLAGSDRRRRDRANSRPVHRPDLGLAHSADNAAGRGLPFRMWFYPLPSLIASAGWIFVFVTVRSGDSVVALGVFASGCVAYAAWQFVIIADAISTGRHSSRGETSRRSAPGQPGSHCVPRRSFMAWVLASGMPPSIFGWKRTERAAIPVVSLGNLTTGGTGKTPFAAFVARWFRERGVHVCFISRGYGAGAGGTNDEALVLDQLCPDVPHLQNPDRVAAASVAPKSSTASSSFSTTDFSTAGSRETSISC